MSDATAPTTIRARLLAALAIAIRTAEDAYQVAIAEHRKTKGPRHADGPGRRSRHLLTRIDVLREAEVALERAAPEFDDAARAARWVTTSPMVFGYLEQRPNAAHPDSVVRHVRSARAALRGVGADLPDAEANSWRGSLDDLFARMDAERPALQKLLEERFESRRAKDWGKAEELRAAIEREGWTVVDEPHGQRVYRVGEAGVHAVGR